MKPAVPVFKNKLSLGVFAKEAGKNQGPCKAKPLSKGRKNFLLMCIALLGFLKVSAGFPWRSQQGMSATVFPEVP